MARLPRLILPSQPHYVFQRGNQAIFQDADDYAAFLVWLRAASKTFKVAVHAYALLPDQLHLLVSPGDEKALGQMMQWIGRYYVPYFNQKYARAGTLWQGRYKTSVIDPVQYFMTCSLYLEFAPVYRGLTVRALDYAWSSHAHHTGLRLDPVITDHPLYWELGNTPFDREAAYSRLAEQALPFDAIQCVEQAVLKGWPLGSDHFKQTLEHRLKRQVMPAKRGRPFKSVEKIGVE
ncbi:putative transposase [Oxalobacteraceae bacterium GrIS 1.11]